MGGSGEHIKHINQTRRYVFVLERALHLQDILKTFKHLMARKDVKIKIDLCCE